MSIRIAFTAWLACFGTAALSQYAPASTAPCGSGAGNDVRLLHSDSLASAFIICVPREVKAHYHAAHTEHVVVIAGEAEMRLGDSLFVIRPGDAIAIPRGTVHAARTLSEEPLRVVSVQAPSFDGTDRIPVER